MKNLNVSAHRPQFDLLLLIPFLLLIMFGWVMIILHHLIMHLIIMAIHFFILSDMGFI